jgi:RND family efflux transporter MFP subunit
MDDFHLGVKPEVGDDDQRQSPWAFFRSLAGERQAKVAAYSMTFLLRRSAWLLVAGLLLSGCSPAEEDQAPGQSVQTIVLGEGVEDSFRRFPGEVAAVRSAELSFNVPGRMIERPATQGMLATEGQVLARLDAENFEARLASARARFVSARDEFARREQLRERGVISDSELDDFRRNFEVAEAEQREAQRALDDTILRAPFDGRVSRTLVNNLQNVQAKQPVLLYQDISTLEIDIDVPEQVMTLGWQGVTAEHAAEKIEAVAEFAALPGLRVPLRLASFSTAASPTTRTFRVTFLFDPPEGHSVLPGMTCTVLARRVGEGVVVEEIFQVPVSAVDLRSEGALVWRLDAESMVVQPVAVELETPQGDFHRVRSAELQPGDELVSAGVRFLAEGMPVRRGRAP